MELLRCHDCRMPIKNRNIDMRHNRATCNVCGYVFSFTDEELFDSKSTRRHRLPPPARADDPRRRKIFTPPDVTATRTSDGGIRIRVELVDPSKKVYILGGIMVMMFLALTILSGQPTFLLGLFFSLLILWLGWVEGVEARKGITVIANRQKIVVSDRGFWGRRERTHDPAFIDQFFCASAFEHVPIVTPNVVTVYQTHFYSVMFVNVYGSRDVLVRGLQELANAQYIEYLLERYYSIEDVWVMGETEKGRPR